MDRIISAVKVIIIIIVGVIIRQTTIEGSLSVISTECHYRMKTGHYIAISNLRTGSKGVRKDFRSPNLYLIIIIIIIIIIYI